MHKLKPQILLPALILLLTGSSLFSSGQKIDTIILTNGNIITGEIKDLELGMLSYKTDAAGTIEVKWEEVSFIKSPRTFDIQTDDRGRYFGSFDFGDSARTAKIVFINDFLLFSLDRLVEVHPLRRNFWMRLDGSVNLGYQFTKASQVSQMNFGGNVSYRGEKMSAGLTLSSIITTQPGQDQSRKQDINVSATKFLKKQWNLTTFIGAEQNTELGLDLRTLLAVGAKNDLIHNNRNYLNAVAGVSINREWSDDFENRTNNLESFAGLQFNKYKRTTPKISIATSAFAFPSLSDLGRIRVNFEVESNFEIISDLFVGLSVYINFDNRPAAEGSANNDWGVITSVGYSF